MAIALDTSKVVRYVCENERSLPKEQQTVWLLKPRTLAAGRAIAQAAKDGTHAEATIQVLRHCLDGWENLLHASGAPAQVKKDQAGLLTEESIGLVPWGVRDELVVVAMRDSTFTEATLGN
jgi:hypothetical protein